jgi:hypothetical protein
MQENKDGTDSYGHEIFIVPYRRLRKSRVIHTRVVTPDSATS